MQLCKLYKNTCNEKMGTNLYYKYIKGHKNVFSMLLLHKKGKNPGLQPALE